MLFFAGSSMHHLRLQIPLERHAHSLRVIVLFVVNTNTTKGGMIYMQDYNTIIGVIVIR